MYLRPVIICLIILSAIFRGSAQENPVRPNIILFIVDDMGWQDCSVPLFRKATDLNSRYRTPAMEKLAREGMKFTNAYATPVCSPSRVSLMTGMNAARHRVTNWTLYRDKTTDQPDSLLSPPNWNLNGLSPVKGIKRTVHVTPLPALLRDAGYYTIHCGKGHFGAMQTPAADPMQIGFDVNIAGHASGGLGSYQGQKNYGNLNKREHTLPWGVPGLEAYHGSSTHLTEALTIEAMKALAKPVKEKRPFFLYMSHYAVHIPLEADQRFIQKYLDAGLPQKEAEYASMVEGMDKSLGDLMDCLEKNNLSQNTIILFISDNGGFSMPPRAGAAFTHNKPLKAGKGSVYEGGIRVPMLVKWPGTTAPGTTANQYLIIEDFFPAILEMAGIKKYTTVQQTDGISFVPILKDPSFSNARRMLTWHFPNKWTQHDGPGINFHSAIRTGEWKLVYNHKTGKKELYNLAEDIGEELDLSEKNPSRTSGMLQLLKHELNRFQAQLPFNRKGREIVLQ